MPDGYRLLWAGWYRLSDGAGPYAWDGAAGFTLKGSSLGGGAGGGALLVGETAGFATDFTYATDAQRVAVKVADVTTNYALDAFYVNTGTSPKQVYGSASTVTNNALKWSEDFSNALWAVDGSATKTSNAVAAPNGTTTADKIASNGSVSYVYQTMTPTVGATTFSIYAKVADAEVPYLWLQDYESGKGDLFNLSNGTVATWVAAEIPSGGAAIQSVGNGWYRCSIPLVSGASNPTFYLYKANTGDDADGIIPSGKGTYVWGAQINAGTAPTMYVATDASVVSEMAPLGWSPHNRVLQSQTFNTSWTTQFTTVVANQAVAPDGTTTMDLVYPTTTGANRWIAGSSSGTPAGMIPASFSVYAKMAGKRWLAMLKFDGSVTGAWFDLQTGVVGTVAAGYTSAIQAVGNGIYRCTMTSNVTTVFNYANIIITDADNSSSVTANATDGIYLWGAQTNSGPVATAYLPTTTAVRFGLAVDYDPVTHANRGALFEPAATNLVPYSSTLDDATWTKLNGTISANAIAAPDGTLSADKLVETVATGEHKVYKAVSVTAVTYTWSFYAKAAERTWLSFTLVDTAGLVIYFNLGTGAVGTVAAGCTATITDVGNGWYRCTATHTMAAASTYIQFGTSTGDGVNSFAGDITKGLYVWGAQLETGTVATSPIPTFAASATRAVDQYTVTSASINYSATAGSWWMEVYQLGISASNPRLLLNLSGSYLANTAANVVLMNDGTSVTKTTSALLNTVHKEAWAFQSGDRAVTADGLTAATDAGVVTNWLAPGATLFFGGTAATVSHCYFRKLRYVPRRKSNAELVTETA